MNGFRIIDLRDTAPAETAPTDRNDEDPRGVPKSLDPRSIAFITAVKDEKQYRICLQYLDALQIPSGYAVEKIAVFGGASMAECYQRAMEASTARYKIYLHVDTYVVYRELLRELLHLFGTYPRLGSVGVVGATRLTASGIFWLNNASHSYGRLWEYDHPPGLWSFLGPLNRRRLYLRRFRSFRGDYLRALMVDGFFIATQYDIPWKHPRFGFELYDHVQAQEFIKAGLEVGIARQESVWCIHWYALQEPTGEQRRRRRIAICEQAAAIRHLYSAFVGVPVQRLYEQQRGVGSIPRDLNSPDPARERLGVVLVTFNGRDVLLRTLRALLPQCEALKEVEYQVIVVDNASIDGTIEAVCREFPQLTVIANASNNSLASGFNLGLQHQGFPRYILIVHDDVEFVNGTLARLVTYLREHPSTAGVIASLGQPDGTLQFQRMALVELMPRQPRRPQKISFVGTTCALVRGEVFFDVGLYDERLRVHGEDLDWSLRARRKGYKFVILPEAKVIHHRSMGSRQNRRTIAVEGFLDNLRLVHKHGGRQWATMLYGIQRLLAKWFEFQCRNDREALRQVDDAMARMKALYRRFREENRLPRFLRHGDA